MSYVSASYGLIQQGDDQCHPWSFYNDTLGDCQCYKTPAISNIDDTTRLDFIAQCSKQKVLLNVKYCMTNEEAGTFLGNCQIYSHNANVTLVAGIYFQLPNNISELNDYMCAPMNRKGRICSECIDGFALSVTSIGHQCSNCTDAWYRVPLYLILEFVPITLFYLAVLVLQVNVTSSPLTYCVAYSQCVVYFFQFFPMRIFLKSTKQITFVKILMTLHGMWNLDSFRFILPPFCVSPKLKFMHIILLGYISAFYPLLLIALTWLTIQIHSRNFGPLVWLWKKLSCFKSNKNSTTTIVDLFCTFFLLSYSKLCFSPIMTFMFTNLFKANSTQIQSVLLGDPSLISFSAEHLPYVVFSASVLLVFGVIPVFLLAVYPIKKLRSFLLIDRLSGRSNAALNIFMERFYSCYRDGLVGGWDLRSFASMHFFIRFLGYLLVQLTFQMSAIVLVGMSVLILLVRPCKQAYMNNIYALILILIALNCFQAGEIHSNSIYSNVYIWSMLATACLPLIAIYVNLIPQKYLMKLQGKFSKFSLCKTLCCYTANQERDSMANINIVGEVQEPERAGVEISESDSLLHNPSHFKPVYL